MDSAATVISEVLKVAGANDPRSLAFDVVEKLDAEDLIIIRRPIAPDPPVVGRLRKVPKGMSEQQLLILDALNGNVYGWVADNSIISKRFVTGEVTGDIAWLAAHRLIERRGDIHKQCRIRDRGLDCLVAARKAGWEGVQKYVSRYFERPQSVQR